MSCHDEVDEKFLRSKWFRSLGFSCFESFGVLNLALWPTLGTGRWTGVSSSLGRKIKRNDLAVKQGDSETDKIFQNASGNLSLSKLIDSQVHRNYKIFVTIRYASFRPLAWLFGSRLTFNITVKNYFVLVYLGYVSHTDDEASCKITAVFLKRPLPATRRFRSPLSPLNRSTRRLWLIHQ